MAYRVIWSSKAIDDVDAITIYIAGDSPSYAAAVVRQILDITHSRSSGMSSSRGNYFRR
jgi:plasmid stabilization system protein ParE